MIVLGSRQRGKVNLVAAVTKDLTERLDAGKIVEEAGRMVEGFGGGGKTWPKPRQESRPSSTKPCSDSHRCGNDALTGTGFES